MDKARTCLLLSMRRAYPESMFDNEDWLWKAQDSLFNLQSPLRSAAHPELPQADAIDPMVKLLYACFMLRARKISVGTYRKSVYRNFKSIDVSLSEEELEHEMQLEMFLSKSSKQTLVRIFLANFRLFQKMQSLADLYPDATSTADTAAELSPSDFLSLGTQRQPRSVIALVEELETSLAEWAWQYDDLLSADLDGTDIPDSANFLCLAQIQLNHQYVSLLQLSRANV